MPDWWSGYEYSALDALESVCLCIDEALVLLVVLSDEVIPAKRVGESIGIHC